jgi:hypothetical protein
MLEPTEGQNDLPPLDMDGDSVRPQVTDKPRKRRRLGGKREQAKKCRVQSHKLGPLCQCTRFECGKKIPNDRREELLKAFNEYNTRKEQDAFLAGLIKPDLVKRRRPRQTPTEAVLREHAYQFYLPTRHEEGSFIQTPVCRQMFMATFGVTRRRISFIQHGLTATGIPPVDRRGQHKSRPHALSHADIETVHAHIKSLRGRKSHYSLSETRRIYLPDELNISKLYKMYKERNQQSRVSYEIYRRIFNNSYNISFGYPRKDTCSTCDVHVVKLRQLSADIASCKDDNRKTVLLKEKQSIETAKKLHLMKAKQFYDRKRAAGIKAKGSQNFAAFCMDFQKNLPVPNISTGDVYYRRQLSFHSFNIHLLGNSDVWFYTYDETVAKKGSDDVTSMLEHFCTEILPEEVREIEIFCDSCSGQNKNYTVFRFLHYSVHNAKRFDSVKVIFPIRGHSYMECDRDMALINQKARAEVPDDWVRVFATARERPTPFNVMQCNQDLFCKHGEFLSEFYKSKCPVPTRDIRELVFKRSVPVMYYRMAYNGMMSSSVITVTKQTTATKKGRKGSKKNDTNQNQAKPQQLYCGPLPLKKAKFADIQALSKFCGETAQRFFAALPVDSHCPNDTSTASDCSADSCED